MRSSDRDMFANALLLECVWICCYAVCCDDAVFATNNLAFLLRVEEYETRREMGVLTFVRLLMGDLSSNRAPTCDMS